MTMTVKLDIDGHFKPGESKEAGQSAILHAIREEVESALKQNAARPEAGGGDYGKCTYTKTVPM